MSPPTRPSIARRSAVTGTRITTPSFVLPTVAAVTLVLTLLAARARGAAGNSDGVRFGPAAAAPAAAAPAGRDQPASTGKPRPADFTAVDVTPGGGRDPAPPVFEPGPAARPVTQPATGPSDSASSGGGGPPGTSDLSGLLSDNLLSHTVPVAVPAGRDGTGGTGASGAGSAKVTAAAAAGPGGSVGGLGLSPVEIGLGSVAILGMIGAGVYAWRRRA